MVTSEFREKDGKEYRMSQAYTPEIEETMRRFYNSLNEKDRRHYAGVEALRFGHGGRSYIASVLGCSRNTVSRGAIEVSGMSKQEVGHRIRKPGGGRKAYTVVWGAKLDEKFLEVLRHHTAGDPMDEKVRWTNLTPGEIVEALREDHGIKVSKYVVRKLLRKHNYRRRKAQKRRSLKGDIKDRNAQFENIEKLRAEFTAAGNPIVSMDTKKKEHIGNLYRDGHLYTLRELQTLDHDFPSYAEGVIIPHTIYDLQRNEGYIQLGTSHDTAAFVGDSFRYWWNTYGQLHYPEATAILVLCDSGGSNSSRHYIFKQELQALADELGIVIRIAHYPPYCSKYNPVEHRFFPHVTRACQGVIFTSLDLVKELMAKTSTSTGLKAFVHIIDKVYATGRKVAADFQANMRIVFDAFLPQWNYQAIPAFSTAQLI
jgi:transposase